MKQNPHIKQNHHKKLKYVWKWPHEKLLAKIIKCIAECKNYNLIGVIKK